MLFFFPTHFSGCKERYDFVVSTLPCAHESITFPRVQCLRKTSDVTEHPQQVKEKPRILSVSILQPEDKYFDPEGKELGVLDY